MCGIAGILSFDSETVSRQRLAAMNDALAHRGPDGEGIEIHGACGLAHRRLSIVDLSEAGHQPMGSPDRALWLTFNGEIYNYLELREELHELGNKFISRTDTEVVLVAYRQWGLDAFARFNGMWALGIWDSVERRLILSRDRLGIKPLYFHKTNRRLVFASEVKALLAGFPELARVDTGSMADFLHQSLVAVGKYTFFEDIERFEAGTTMVITDSGSITRRPYWTFEPPEVPIRVSDADAAERVRELLIDAVRLRFRSDVPVGTCLSGGLDSSSIVAIAAKTLGKAPETFSALYDIPGYEEREFVDAMIDDVGLSANKITPNSNDLPDVMERLAYFQEEPTAGPGLYSQWHVMKAAAQKVTVLLDGQGGDEVFGGYFPYFQPYTQSLLRKVTQLDFEAGVELWQARNAIKTLTGEDPVRTLAYLRYRGYRARARQVFMRGVRAVRGPISLVPSLHELAKKTRRSLRSPDAPMPSRLYTQELVPPHRRPLELTPSGDPLIDRCWDQLLRASVPGLLHYEDRNSMAFSIEARVPFLDHRLVEYVFTLPNRARIRGSRTKAVLRDAMRGLLPEKVRERTDKKGYPTPFALWIRDNAHREWARDLLCGRQTRERGWIDVALAERLWNDHLAGADHSWRLWAAITTELFCRRYADGPFKADPILPRAIRSERAQ